MKSIKLIFAMIFACIVESCFGTPQMEPVPNSDEIDHSLETDQPPKMKSIPNSGEIVNLPLAVMDHLASETNQPPKMEPKKNVGARWSWPWEFKLPPPGPDDVYKNGKTYKRQGNNLVLYRPKPTPPAYSVSPWG